MKITIIYILVAAALTSCGLHAPAEWASTPNPLLTPPTIQVRPPSMGHFGPNAEYYPTWLR